MRLEKVRFIFLLPISLLNDHIQNFATSGAKLHKFTLDSSVDLQSPYGINSKLPSIDRNYTFFRYRSMHTYGQQEDNDQGIKSKGASRASHISNNSPNLASLFQEKISHCLSKLMIW